MQAKSGQRTISNATLNREVKGRHVEVFNLDPPFFAGTPTMIAAISGIEMYSARDGGGGSHRHELQVQLDKPTFDPGPSTVSVAIEKKQGIVIQSITISWIAIGE